MDKLVCGSCGLTVARPPEGLHRNAGDELSRCSGAFTPLPSESVVETHRRLGVELEKLRAALIRLNADLDVVSRSSSRIGARRIVSLARRLKKYEGFGEDLIIDRDVLETTARGVQAISETVNGTIVEITNRIIEVENEMAPLQGPVSEAKREREAINRAERRRLEELRALEIKRLSRGRLDYNLYGQGEADHWLVNGAILPSVFSSAIRARLDSIRDVTCSTCHLPVTVTGPYALRVRHTQDSECENEGAPLHNSDKVYLYQKYVTDGLIPSWEIERLIDG